MRNMEIIDNPRRFYFSAIIYILVTSSAFADSDCDFDKPAGSCSATYTLQNIKNDPNKVNSSAEVNLTSSASQCSRISFYVDSTPYISVLSHTNSSIAQIFGTSTINKESISIDSCTAFGLKDSTSTSKDDDNPVVAAFNSAVENPEPFDPSASDSRAAQILGQAGGGASFDGQALGAVLSVLGGAAQGLSAVQPANSVRAAAAATVIKTLPGEAPGADRRQPMTVPQITPTSTSGGCDANANIVNGRLNPGCF